MLRKARVVAVHPESHAVDLVLMDSGRRFSGVQVMAGVAGGNVGGVDLPEPSVTDPKKPYESGNTGVRDMYAAVAFMGDIPVVVGFLYPQVSQSLFGGEIGRNRKIYRHASDVYHTIDGAGNMELHHPSGTYFRIGESADHENLTGQDYDKIWNQAHNTQRQVHVALEVYAKPDADHPAVRNLSLRIDPLGNVVVSTLGTVTLTAAGEITVTAPNVVIDATVHITKKVTVDDDVVASGVSLVHHVHGGVQSGGSKTGEPVK